MKLASLRTGLHLTLNDVPFIVNRILETGDCYLERKSDLAVVKRSKTQLMDAFFNGELVIHGKDVVPKTNHRSEVDINGFTENNQRLVMRKYHYVKAARDILGEIPVKNELDIVIERVSEKLDDDNPPSESSVYRWWRSWRENHYDIGVFVNKSPGPKGLRKFKGTVYQELVRVVEEVFLTRQKDSKQATYDALVAQITTLNMARKKPLPIPSRASFYRIVNGFDKYEIMAAREGKRAADKTYRATGLGAQPNNILERVEVDHTPLDVHLLNPETGKADGRPYLTLLLDRYSRMPLGFEIGFEPPSEISVMRALRNAILPKTYIEKSFPDFKHKWIAFGKPIMLICDNGLEFHSHQLRRMCGELDIDLQFCPKKRPEYKGSVERILGTLNRAVCHRLPGTTFSNINQRGDYESEQEAIITLEDLKELVHEWVIDIYCQTTHKVTQRTPYSLWSDGLKVVEPMLPESRDQLDLILTVEDERVLSHRGIEFKGLFYNSSELGAFRHRSHDSLKLKFRYDKENLGYIWVYDEFEGNYLKVPCIDPDYADGLTLRQHLQIRAEARAKGASDQDSEALIKSKERFRKKIEKKSQHKLLRERRKAARDNSEALRKSPESTAWSANSTESSNNEFPIGDWDLDEIPTFSVMER
ncbi:transposase [Ketobacter sp. MCCC 1A13808]|uniref:Mu transposase C-terminal domain-containing protein n=1 Tax=Ketobacter sp. MCCC 1A13808 TaxID=2602738 RepID=UPI0012EB1BA1|nr:Mu transposase C-terminal domain-containing protein [Ketobacter sp. MCCC 1A13808]MVF14234.1 transposase [Ketobacter sp. MCCC 1A13808]